MVAGTIDRLAIKKPAEFFRHYVFAQKPAIITNLFEGQPIREITTMECASRAFGQAPLNVRQEYVSEHISKTTTPPREMTFDEFWLFVHAHPETRLLCTEYEIPARVMAQFRLPSMCLTTDGHADEILSLPRRYGDHDLWSNVFIAAAGNKAHLHFDGDHRQVLLYQVFGRKEFVLFPPASGKHLHPLDAQPGFSGLFLDEMSDEEISDLVDRAGGYRGMLEPGEALFIPMLMWHHFKYVDDAMSFNIRFARNRYGRFLSIDNLHRDYYNQNFSSRLADADSIAGLFANEMEEIVGEYLRPASDREAKVRGMRSLLRRLCMHVCPEAEPDAHCPPSREEAEIRKIMKDIETNNAYLSPEQIRACRPQGAASAVQQNHVRRTAAALKYHDELLGQLLLNRVGKADVRLLTNAEAGLFMNYMRSPGARW